MTHRGTNFTVIFSAVILHVNNVDVSMLNVVAPNIHSEYLQNSILKYYRKVIYRVSWRGLPYKIAINSISW
jgi:hypothetical protein